MSKFNIENPKLTAKNPHFGNKYAPLDEVLRVVKAGLPEDASITQGAIVGNSGHLLFRTAVTANGGADYEFVDIPFVLGKQDPQGLGSAITYHRRYGLCLLFNLVGEEDDDAEAAHGRGKSTKASTKKRKPAKKAAPKKPTPTPQPAAETNEEDDW